MLGPLKFGLQKPLAPVPTVKAVAAPGRFELTLSLEGDTIDNIGLIGPKGATAYIDWGDGTNSSIGITGAIYTINNHSCGSTATISGSNLITGIKLVQTESLKLKGIVGTYPTSLLQFYVGFNYVDPVFTPPNIGTLYFYGSSGPSSLTTGSNLIGLHGLPPNLTTLNLAPSTELTSLPTLPAGLINLYTPPGITGLTGLPGTLTVLDTSKSIKLTRLPTLPAGLIKLYTPPGITGLPSLPTSLTELNTLNSTKITSLSILGNTKLRYISLSPACKSLDVSGCTGLENIRVEFISPLTTLDISNCTALTRIPPLPALTTLRIDGSGLRSLDLTGTSVTTLNIPPSMDTQLKTVAFGSKLKPSGLFRFEIPEDGNWTLY